MFIRLVLFWDRVSCSLVWPPTYYENTDCISDLPASISRSAGVLAMCLLYVVLGTKSGISCMLSELYILSPTRKKKKRSIYYAPTVCQALGLERKKKYRRVLLSWTPHSSGRRQTSWVWWHMPLIPALEVPGYVERYYLKQKQTRRHAITEGAKWRTVIEAIDVTENTRMAWEWSGWGLRPIEDDISAKVWEV